MRHCIVIGGMLVAAFAGQPPEPGAESRAVAGVVIDAVTAAPIPGASVFLDPGSGQRLSTKTNAAGSFFFGAVAGSNPWLKVVRQGYQSEGSGSPEAGLAVPPAPASERLTVKMMPLSVVQGRILNADGEPLVGLQVQAWRVQVIGGKRQVDVRATTTSNDRGEYRLWHLPPGSYLVRVSHRIWTPRSLLPTVTRTEPSETYEAVYFPAAQDQTGAQVLKLTPGKEFGADFTLQARLPYGIRGVVSNYPRGARGTVRLLRGEEEVGRQTFLDVTTGAFEVSGVPPGSYLLQVATDSPDTPGIAETRITVENRSVIGLTMTLGYGVEATGNLRLVSGAPAIPVPVIRIDAGMLSRRAYPVHPRSAVALVPGEGGSFILKKLLPGRYTVHVGIRDGYYVSAIRSGSTDVLAEGLTIGTSSPPPLTIEVSKGSARIEGTVTGIPDGKRAMVAIVRPGNLSAPSTILGTDSNGKFLAAVGVFPGKCLIYAWILPDDPEYLNPVLSARGVPVALQDGATAIVSVPVLREGDD